jgi:hypothetical protein
MWLVTTFLVSIVQYAKGVRTPAGLPILNTPTVPIYIYHNALDTVKCLMFYVIPSLTSGYLIIGLLIFGQLDKEKASD